MSDDHRRERRRETWGGGERLWRSVAGGIVVGALALLGAFGGLGDGLSGLGHSAASADRAVEAVVRSPHRAGPPPLGSRWRLTPDNAVIFYGGYFCATEPSGRRVRLVLALRELDTLTQGSSSVVGPFSSNTHARVAC